MRAAASVAAPAKVNLFLRVLHRRADGFHELDTLFQAVSLHDDVRVELGASVGAASGIELRVNGPDLGPVEDNLAYRAAARLREVAGVDDPVRIELTKRIPAGAGLGGGSSDAAAVLKCLAALTGFSDTAALHAAAAELGSDVPFFLGRSALSRGSGRGEVLSELAPLPEAVLVLALPEVHVATGGAYAALAAHRGTGGAVTPAPDDGFRTWDAVAAAASNDFEAVVASKHPEIEACLAGLRQRGARFALLSGSGAASFGVFDDTEHARAAASWLSGHHGFPFVPVTTLGAMPVPRVEQSS